jgi:amino-acid N-acetyltransferase
MPAASAPTFWIRPARTTDVTAIRRLIDTFAPDRRLLSKATVTLYEDIGEFVVAQSLDGVIGCGALHVMWEDLAEVRTVAVQPDFARRGIGRGLVRALIDKAAGLGVRRVFCLTFEVEFFRHIGFAEFTETPISSEVYTQLLQSEDEGVAEFLNLERVKPNTLGNTRMLLRLTP